MSQNKTVIQGLEPADASGYNSGTTNLYSRGSRPVGNGTIVPGMSENKGESFSTSQQQHQHKSVASGKPVVGFLYSVSRTASGEYWPLHIGQNTIGQNPDCDVALPEGTVSSDHAVIVIRKMKNPEKVIASISDARSTNGTMINGVSLGFAAVECHNGDIITIGDAYELVLILVDVASLGLKVQENFIGVDIEGEENVNDEQPPMMGYTRPGEGYIPDGFTTPPPYGGGYSPANGTIGFDGSGSGEKGGTVGM